ncbi:hypothetical protein BPC006_I3806 [Burkholderia pseudomallei BPC006]|nr:hypothetical protein BPC006_I3806 [Burkholderia pseudomallei BPC006]
MRLGRRGLFAHAVARANGLRGPPRPAAFVRR